PRARSQAARLRPLLARALGDVYDVTDAPMRSQIGSGALPVDELPSHGLAIRAARRTGASLERLEAALRARPRPVIGRRADDHGLSIGTAGHIDHGKTTLVRSLTGVDTDRLEEEKRRGISIELGYAYTTLPDGGMLGFIDVPGHERLVHTMVAGACGIDFALLVLAADDGVMPQTRE